jgi:hypothetical protein
MAAFDDQMGSPSIFRQYAYLPSAWQAEGPDTGAVSVRPEALREAALATGGLSGLGGVDPARQDPQNGETGPDCATLPPGAPAPSMDSAEMPDAPRAVVTRLLPDRVVLDVTADCRRLLVLTDTWAPGWGVWIDGRPAQALRVDVAIRGAIVPAGRHVVEWVYRPVHLAACLALMGASFVVAALLFMAPWLSSAWDRRRYARLAGTPARSHDFGKLPV